MLLALLILSEHLLDLVLLLLKMLLRRLLTVRIVMSGLHIVEKDCWKKLTIERNNAMATTGAPLWLWLAVGSGGSKHTIQSCGSSRYA